ncbi:hypothetical protein [Streptomyces antimicrobicus]|uniref:RDD domain-containing protein n=1 Tax=Streptomyces antimicrobicus TaxID=2883108 RepID=A0ABS8BCA7_9ACTN|nr:hypothetical protein [Streptomyces antimicrobicus]MCB5182161.1 hypothetical protein [Streptomyces antimicrobicus]
MATHSRVRARGPVTAARLIALVADIAALILVLWIALYLLDANRSNEVVAWIHDAATWLAGWSLDLFTISREWLRVVVGYGLPAVVYLLVGHAVARALARRA